jgi:hypothetical protein
MLNLCFPAHNVLNHAFCLCLLTASLCYLKLTDIYHPNSTIHSRVNEAVAIKTPRPQSPIRKAFSSSYQPRETMAGSRGKLFLLAALGVLSILSLPAATHGWASGGATWYGGPSGDGSEGKPNICNGRVAYINFDALNVHCN